MRELEHWPLKQAVAADLIIPLSNFIKAETKGFLCVLEVSAIIAPALAVPCDQCDQTAIVFVQFMAIWNN